MRRGFSFSRNANTSAIRATHNVPRNTSCREDERLRRTASACAEGPTLVVVPASSRLGFAHSAAAAPSRCTHCAVNRVRKIVPNAATPNVAPIDRKNCTVAVALPMSFGLMEFCIATR